MWQHLNKIIGRCEVYYILFALIAYRRKNWRFERIIFGGRDVNIRCIPLFFLHMGYYVCCFIWIGLSGAGPVFQSKNPCHGYSGSRGISNLFNAFIIAVKY
jgi:hypothetical protein